VDYKVLLEKNRTKATRAAPHNSIFNCFWTTGALLFMLAVSERQEILESLQSKDMFTQSSKSTVTLNFMSSRRGKKNKIVNRTENPESTNKMSNWAIGLIGPRLLLYAIVLCDAVAPNGKSTRQTAGAASGALNVARSSDAAWPVR
jgi:hypothetical protein